jgi:hypothetical protein
MSLSTEIPQLELEIISAAAQETQPRNFSFNAQEIVENVRFLVNFEHRLSIPPEIISDLDSIDDGQDLDSGRERHLLDVMEKNKQLVLEHDGDDNSFQFKSDIYSQISHNKRSRESSSSSVLELSPSPSDEHITSTAVSAQDKVKPAVVVAGPFVSTIAPATVAGLSVPVNNPFDDDDSIELSDIEIPGLEDAPITAPLPVKNFGVGSVQIDANSTKPSSWLPALSPEETAPTLLENKENVRYEEEIKSLRQRLEREEKLEEEQKKKFFELQQSLSRFEQLAKSQMQNYLSVHSESNRNSITALPDENSISASVASPSTVFQQLEAYKKKSEQEIANLKHILDEERSKTNRFEVLKMERDELGAQLKLKNDQIKTLENSLSKAELCELEMGKKLKEQERELESAKIQGEHGYVYEQKKKLMSTSGSNSSLNSVSGLKKGARSSNNVMIDSKFQNTLKLTKEESDELEYAKKNLADQVVEIQNLKEKVKFLENESIAIKSKERENFSALSTKFGVFKSGLKSFARMMALDWGKKDILVEVETNFQDTVFSESKNDFREIVSRVANEDAKRVAAEANMLNFKIYPLFNGKNSLVKRKV